MLKHFAKRKVLFVCAVAVMLLCLCGCKQTQATRASYNIALEADNFNVTRRIVVINARTDKPMFEFIGNFSLKNNMSNELEIICEVSPGVYKKHFVYLNEWTLYVVEDVSGSNVNKYRYEINYMPETIIPFDVVTID